MSALAVVPSLSIDLASDGGRIVTLDGSLRGGEAAAVLEELGLLLELTSGDLVIDLRGLAGIDAYTVAQLRGALSRCREQRRAAVIVRPNERLWEVLCHAGVDRDCRSTDCLREALAAVA